jgi:arabinan endo-1,5-alpha-L-arabinosidase
VDVQEPGRLLFADEFSGTELDSAWSWVRGEAATYELGDGVLAIDIEATELYVDTNTAPVLVRDAPKGDYVIETAVRVDIPEDPECCYNYAQGGVVVYQDDDNFVKLTNTSIWNTRQTEWAKELYPVPEGWSRYGNTVVGPPSESGEWTYLRIVVERLNGAERQEAGGDTHAYTAYTSQDGETWVRGGTWTHTLTDAQIALVAMGLNPDQSIPGDYTAEFDYVRVYSLRERPAH